MRSVAQARAAGKTEIRVRRTNSSATRAIQMRRLVPLVDDQVADVWDPRERIRENDHMMLVVEDRIK